MSIKSALPVYLEAAAFLLLLPGRDDLVFIFFTLNLERSPELMASPDFAWRFFPPNPYFSFFF